MDIYLITVDSDTVVLWEWDEATSHVGYMKGFHWEYDCEAGS